MKLFTAAMALKVLGPETTFPTTVLYSPAVRGSAAGQLWLRGGGDMSLGASDLDDLSQKVKKNGVKNFATVGVYSSLYRAEGFANRFPDGWTLDDTLWYYGPTVSALAYERNHIDVTITGGIKTGDKATIATPEGAPQFIIGDNLKTGRADLAKRDSDDLLTVQSLGEHGYTTMNGTINGVPINRGTTVISGEVAPNQKVSLGIAVPSVDDWVSSAFAASLQRSGVPQFTKAPGLKAKAEPVSFGPAREIARHESPPVKELLKRLLKNSDNLYAEMMLRNAALYSIPESYRGPYPSVPPFNYAARGHQLIFDWLKENNISTDGLKFTDGSGLSRYDMVTPRALAGVLSAVEKVPGANYFYDALPIAGVDGTMKNRCKGTLAENNARAKSGTFSIVSCLSGYVTTKDKQRLSIVILTNFVPDGTAARKMQDAIFNTLAEADISSNNGIQP
jgi:D-alanyl-D-alanine carboxypeptidase/D-alanyl-D-alanine-endopeptidase (penicillin-binding protein 4)